MRGSCDPKTYQQARILFKSPKETLTTHFEQPSVQNSWFLGFTDFFCKWKTRFRWNMKIVIMRWQVDPTISIPIRLRWFIIFWSRNNVCRVKNHDFWPFADFLKAFWGWKNPSRVKKIIECDRARPLPMSRYQVYCLTPNILGDIAIGKKHIFFRKVTLLGRELKRYIILNILRIKKSNTIFYNHLFWQWIVTGNESYEIYKS